MAEKPARSPSTELKGARPMRGSDAQSRHYQSLTVTIASLLRLVLFLFPAGSFKGAAADSAEGHIRLSGSCKQPPPISHTTFWPLDRARAPYSNRPRAHASGRRVRSRGRTVTAPHWSPPLCDAPGASTAAAALSVIWLHANPKKTDR